MSITLVIVTAIAVNTLLAPLVAADDRFTLDLETGAAWELRNDFAVPGATGTLVRLDDEVYSFATFAYVIAGAQFRW